MENEIVRDMGAQPLDAIMVELEISGSDLVSASDEQITHKMVSKGRKGRRLSPGVQKKLMRALNKKAEREYALSDLFNYH